MEENRNKTESGDTPESIKSTGSVISTSGEETIHCLTVIGQIEGHYALGDGQKATKYEHLIPLLVSIEESREIDGMLMVLNTMGGDVEAGLALAEMVASMSKPTVSLVLGGGHVHDAGAKSQHSVFGNGDDLRFHAHGLYLYRVSRSDLSCGFLLLRYFYTGTKGSLLLVEAVAKPSAGFIDGLSVLLVIGALFHLVQLGKDFLRGLPRLGNYPFRLPAGFLIGLFKAHFQLCLEEGGFFGVFLRLPEKPRRLIPVLFHEKPCLLQLLDGCFKAGGVGIDALFGVLYDIVTQSQTA